MMKKTITAFVFTGLFTLALCAAEGCCGKCKDPKKDAACKGSKKECTVKNCNHHAAKKANNNNNGTEVITTEEEIVIIGEAVPANTAKTPTPAAAKTK